MENPSFEDAFPIGTGGPFPASHVSLLEGTYFMVHVSQGFHVAVANLCRTQGHRAAMYTESLHR